MSDDLYEAFGGDDLFEEEEQEPETTEGEVQNRTFLIAVAIMGGLLACALVAFGVWALVINPRMQEAARQNGDAIGMVTETPPGDMTTEETPATEATKPTDETTEKPTSTPKPTWTPTPVVGPTSTPTPEADDGGGDATGTDATATPASSSERRTPTPTPESTGDGAKPTPPSSSSGTSTEQTPDTGLGELALFAAALLLIGVFSITRKLRKA